MDPLELVNVELAPEVQQVHLGLRGADVYLTLRESEALIKQLGEVNAKLRVIIARDGDAAA